MKPELDTSETLKNRFEAWKATTLAESLRRMPERRSSFETLSGEPVERVYIRLDSSTDDELPGEFPYTRGVHPTGYRARPWTMRMFAGFSTAEETNARYRYLLEQGNMGLSIAFDLPTLMGYDTDAPEAEGEFGRCGVAVCSLLDMEILLDGLPLADISTSMTINSPACILWAFYLAAAQKRGISIGKLRGTLQNDILKEYVAQKEYIFPPEPSMRLVTDTIEFGALHVPEWNTISVSGYHIREAGSTAAQELAFTLANGREYVRWALDRGLDIDTFAPRISFFFNVHNDFFEEIAKLRAARRIWARQMRDVFGARNPRSWMCRFHCQTAGVSLTAQQPQNNIVRTAYQAMAAVLGGAQSLHTNSMDEALALPSEEAVTLALRTQQILLEETGVASSVDPLGGSFLIEALTDRMEAQALATFAHIDALGGVMPALELGYMQQEIADASYRQQREVDSGRRIIVGVNGYTDDDAVRIPILEMDPHGYEKQVTRLNELRRSRDPDLVQTCLRAVEEACRTHANVMPALIDAANAYCTLGDLTGVMREVFGVYHERAVI